MAHHPREVNVTGCPGELQAAQLPTPADLMGVLLAVAPQVGGPRTVAAAPELMVALGLSLPDEP